MLNANARTRPMRSPSQPKNTPPVAAPTRNTAMMAPNHCVACAADEGPSRSFNAGPPMSGKRPISKPSNIHPSKAAVSAIQRPKLDSSRCGAEIVVPVFGAVSSNAGPSIGLIGVGKYRMSSPLPARLRARGKFRCAMAWQGPSGGPMPAVDRAELPVANAREDGLRAREVRDMPDPPRNYWRLVGPGIVAGGVGLSSGEFVLWPFI